MNLNEVLSQPIEKKIGQMFFIGVSGTEIDSGVGDLLSDIEPGGICFFARNVRSAGQVRKFTDDLRSRAQIEPLLSIDQEGGLVDRLRRISTPMPAASAINHPSNAAILAELTAEILRILGFNMNFAPVVDVVNEERSKYSNGALNSRAFGRSKEDVVLLAGKYLETLQNGGVAGCLKHFPGLGGAKKDAHDELPFIEITEQEFDETDLFPYKVLFDKQKIQAVMAAHACFPGSHLQETGQDGKLLPSSLSFNFVTTLLREKLNFEGLAITDDLEMGAIVNDYGIGKASVMAMKAGHDLLAICANESAVREGFSAVFNAVQSGEIPESRIDASLRRIVKVKSQLKKPLPFDSARLTELSEKVAELNNQLKYQYGG